MSDIKLTDEEILEYAIAEEGLLFASESDYLEIAHIVIEQINQKRRAIIEQDNVEPVRMFRMQKPPIPVPWHIGEILYEGYSSIYGTGQSIERLSERGGFAWAEIPFIIGENPKALKAILAYMQNNPLPKYYLHPPKDSTVQLGKPHTKEQVQEWIKSQQDSTEPASKDWVMVPRIATEEMINAAMEDIDYLDSEEGMVRSGIRKEWKAMIAAAPTMPKDEDHDN